MDILEPFERMIASVASPAAIRAVEADGNSDAMWSEIASSGYLDALVPEAKGGAGLSLSEVEPLLRVLGRHAVPLPVAETMAARAIAAQTGDISPEGPTMLNTGHRALAAVLAAAKIAGCAERLLEMSITHANDRVQFGKPIARQQAIQHQLAVMGEQLLMARMAGQIGCAAGLAPSARSAATAKQVASAAAGKVAAIAHGVHGAMGITQGFDLQLYTRRIRTLRLHAGSESYWARVLGQARLDDSTTASVAWLADGGENQYIAQ